MELIAFLLFYEIRKEVVREKKRERQKLAVMDLNQGERKSDGKKAVQPVGNVLDVEETRTESDSWPAFFFFSSSSSSHRFTPNMLKLTITIYFELEELRRVWHKEDDRQTRFFCEHRTNTMSPDNKPDTTQSTFLPFSLLLLLLCSAEDGWLTPKETFWFYFAQKMVYFRRKYEATKISTKWLIE